MITSLLMPSSSQGFSQSRGWLIAGGVLSIVVGLAAIGSPYIFSLVIAQLLGAFALVSGIISLLLALFGKHATHRVLDAVSAVIRIAAGVVLLRCAASSAAVITLIFAIFLFAEGVVLIIGALNMRRHAGWIWTLINGLIALVFGLVVYSQWPSNSDWFLGMIYGINSLFWGLSLLTLAFGAPKQPAA